MITREDLQRALPQLDGTLRLGGLDAPVEVFRDGFGIPHVRASSERDAFFAQGFVTAQDRLWQMEYDRKRGSGRWAEVVGVSALEQDQLMRRFRLEASARADYQAASDETRDMMDAYAEGVNAFLGSTRSLPIEYRITGIDPEPWQPWDGLIVYKVRHILMGVFESKLWRARMVGKLGPEQAGRLHPGYEPGQLLILPPGAAYSGPLEDGLEELTQGAAALNYLNETEIGSNSWAISGGRTASGKPLLAGDSHRGLDTPNVYYQNHLACPDFDVTGLSFPGVMGFPHFGHNQWTAWCVTHTAADYQDLYIERFKADDPNYYLYKGSWRRAEVHRERIKAKSCDEVSQDVWVTHHGPVISGDPRNGTGLALKYTATDEASGWADILRGMLKAKSAEELIEAHREWVDPCNNLVLADVHGNIAYQVRGRIPVRSMTNAWLPVPGWTGDHEWQGHVPFDELPRSLNPDTGYIATANNRPVSPDYPYYIAIDFTPEFRCKRVTEGVLALDRADVADMSKIHSQRVSIPAEAYLKLLQRVEPKDEISARAKELLSAWSGSMDATRAEPAIYSLWRDSLLKEVLEHNLGPELAEQAWHPADRALGTFGNRLKARMVTMISQDDRSLLPPGEDWPSLMASALGRAAAVLGERLGADPERWLWERIHRAKPKHTLSPVYPDLSDLLDPPEIPTSGDGDTPLQGGYSPADPATVTSLSVARYAYDLADWDRSLWAVPLGGSGHPGSKHYHDQSETWRQVQMVPMLYSWDRIAAESQVQQRLEPG